MTELEDVDTTERQPVKFLCEVNQVDLDGRWYRDDCRIRPGDNIKIRQEGKQSPPQALPTSSIFLFVCILAHFLDFKTGGEYACS